jgi:hypothetical protein
VSKNKLSPLWAIAQWNDLALNNPDGWRKLGGLMGGMFLGTAETIGQGQRVRA